MAEYVVTTDPDLSGQWESLAAEERANTLIGNRSTDETIAERAKAKAESLKKERAELEDRIAAAARIITTQRVEPKVWGRVVAECPPRPDDPYDARMGVNTDTFDRAIMPHAITSVTDGLGEPVDWDWDGLATAMAPGQYQEIIADVIRLHMERDAVPFSLADYRSRRSSEQSSK